MAVVLKKFSKGHSPQRSYKWRVMIQGMSEELPPEIIQDCSLPIRANESNPVHQGGTNDYYPSFVDISSLTLTFLETTLGRVSKTIEFWKQLIQRDDELFNYSSVYKREVFCDLTDGLNNIHTRYHLVGVWPTAASPTPLDYSTSDIWRISQEFSVDGGRVLLGGGRGLGPQGQVVRPDSRAVQPPPPPPQPYDDPLPPQNFSPAAQRARVRLGLPPNRL